MFSNRETEKKILEDIEELSEAVAELLKNSNEDTRGLRGRVNTLKKEISTLEIERDRERERRERQQREVEHKVGLERMRFDEEKKEHEKEVEIAKREARLSVREDQLSIERERFEKQLKEMRGQFESEGRRREEIMAQILKRLPNINVEASLGGHPAERGHDG